MPVPVMVLVPVAVLPNGVVTPASDCRNDVPVTVIVEFVPPTIDKLGAVGAAVKEVAATPEPFNATSKVPAVVCVAMTAPVRPAPNVIVEEAGKLLIAAWLPVPVKPKFLVPGITAAASKAAPPTVCSRFTISMLESNNPLFSKIIIELN